MNKKIDELLSSNYDGIQEYDNDLPRWWQTLFIITIVFSVIYVIFYHVTSNFSSEAQLQEELKAIAAQKQAAPVTQVSAESLLAIAKDSDHLAAGKSIFQTNCSPCHGPDGQGVVGPNLTDNYWIHGGVITDIRKTIEIGVPDKGMIAWNGMLTPAQIDDVTAFIFSLRGTNPPNPKAPQGDLNPAA